MKFFHIPNHSSSAGEVGIPPWEFEPNVPEFDNKPAYKDWCKDLATRHFFYSGYVGLNPGLRPKRGDNPPESMIAFVADYDTQIGDDLFDTIHSRSPEGFMPTWGSRTFSGGARLVWLFETPILCHHESLHEKFLEIAIRELGIASVLPGFDRGAFMDVTKTYDVGTEWRELSDTSIRPETIQAWLYKAAGQIQFRSDSAAEIPLERVAEEVEKKFPGRWKGEFKLGARGCRFWDPMGDNHTAAIVTENGMMTFTSTAFVSWRQIFGHRFVEQFLEDRLAAATAGIFFDGSHYHYKSLGGIWIMRKKEDLALDLKVRCQLSATPGPRGSASEIERAIHYVQNHNFVSRALPFVHQAEGVLVRMGERCLNISSVTALMPSPEPQEWGKNFPFIAKLLDGFFDPPEQLAYFLAWLKWGYGNALAKDMQKGQNIFIAGGAGRGKTLINSVLISELLGGSADATGYLLGDTNFNASLFRYNHWMVDDSTPGKDSRTHAFFSAMVKKMAANNWFEFAQKFRDAQMVDWRGRLVVTLNKDAESLRMLPDADLSILDKLCFFKASDDEFVFPSKAGDLVRSELPFFARWLLDWQMPPHVIGHSRFGVKEYHEKSLLDEARRAGKTADFRELLQNFRESYFKINQDSPIWEGTATDLILSMACDRDGLGEVIRAMKLTSAQAGRELVKLQALGFALESRILKGIRLWTIRREDDGFAAKGGEL